MLEVHVCTSVRVWDMRARPSLLMSVQDVTPEL